MFEAINTWAYKAMPTLIVTATVAMVSSAFSFYTNVAKLTDKVASHDAQIVELKTKLEAVDSNAVKRQEVLEIMKRIEQQLEIVLLRSGVKVPPKTIGSDR